MLFQARPQFVDKMSKCVEPLNWALMTKYHPSSVMFVLREFRNDEFYWINEWGKKDGKLLKNRYFENDNYYFYFYRNAIEFWNVMNCRMADFHDIIRLTWLEPQFFAVKFGWPIFAFKHIVKNRCAVQCSDFSLKTAQNMNQLSMVTLG